MTVSTSIRGTSIGATETTRVRDVSDRIAQLQPEAAPLLTFMNALKRKQEATSAKFEWFEDDLVPNTIICTNAASDGTSLGVSAGDGNIIRNGDILVAPNGESILVTAGQSTTGLTVTRSVGGVAAFNLAANDQLIVAGNAADEGGTTPLYRFTQKVPKTNYIQIFRDPVKITVTADAEKLYGGNDRTYQRKKVAIEHKRGIENMLLFGDSSETAGSNGGYIRTSKGLYNWISSNTLACGGTLSESEFESLLRDVFRYVAESNGTKVLLASPLMVSAINFWAKSALTVRSDEKTYGMRITTYRSAHGDLDIVKHWLLYDYSTMDASDANSGFDKISFIVDPANVGYRYLTGLDTKLHVDIGQPTEEYFLDEYRTHCGFECKLEQTHGLVTQIAGFSS